MFESKEFRFRTNVSVGTYESKAEAVACLSREGAKAVGKSKMAFKEALVTTDEFLQLATQGHAFCNLFQFDPQKEYWFEAKSGKRYKQRPLYSRGENKGAMKLCFKSDEFFMGSQTVFVDIDFTRFTNVEDYLKGLSYRPTCVYMSYSDGLEKHGRVSRRFRLVYVFSSVLDKQSFLRCSHAISDRIVEDLCEPLDDDCGTRASQYMNGVFSNGETYSYHCIYEPNDFPEEPEQEEEPSEPDSIEKEGVSFDEDLLHDMGTMSYEDFMHYHSLQYPYMYRVERPEWIEGEYQLTDENYLQLWFFREKQVDGQKRRRKLSRNACLRRLMFPDMDANTALFNLYVDFVRFFDNSDHVITLDTLVRKVRHAFTRTREQLVAICDADITYWREHRPKFIVRRGALITQGKLSEIAKKVRWSEIDADYDRSLSVRENIEKGVTASKSTLYRYRKARFIASRHGPTYREQREMRKDAKRKRFEDFTILYDEGKSLRENQTYMEARGLKLSAGTIRNYAAKLQRQPAQADIGFSHVKFTLPDFLDEPGWGISFSQRVGQVFGNLNLFVS